MGFALVVEKGVVLSYILACSVWVERGLDGVEWSASKGSVIVDRLGNFLVLFEEGWGLLPGWFDAVVGRDQGWWWLRRSDWSVWLGVLVVILQDIISCSLKVFNVQDFIVICYIDSLVLIWWSWHWDHFTRSQLYLILSLPLLFQ